MQRKYQLGEPLYRQEKYWEFQGIYLSRTEDIPIHDAILFPYDTIDELELSVRAYNCLKRASINSMSELLKKSEHDLLNIKNFGKKSSDEVIERLHHFGLDLAPNPEMDEEGMVIESAE